MAGLTSKLARAGIVELPGLAYVRKPANTVSKWGNLMKVLAIGSIIKPVCDEYWKQLIRQEVPGTLTHYLEGKIEQAWHRQDVRGVVFLMNVVSVEHAKDALNASPLVVGGFAKYDFFPIGPCAPG